ncbi:MAG: hypothetical protein JW726_09880, partial [Anaerolineales bacterium]|nr:hypothetical protein [Anaerolineales bacterium]
DVGDVQLTIGQDGGMIVLWLEQVPDGIHVVRRLPGAPGWETTQRLDAGWGNTDIFPVYALLGDGGLAAVMWQESNPADSSVDGVFWCVYNPELGNWSVLPGLVLHP